MQLTLVSPEYSRSAVSVATPLSKLLKGLPALRTLLTTRRMVFLSIAVSVRIEHCRFL